METHHPDSEPRSKQLSRLPKTEMKFSDVSLALVNGEGLPPTLGLLTIHKDTKKIVHICKDTGKEISFYLADWSLPTSKPMAKLCLNRSRGSSLSEDLVHIVIEGRSTKDTDAIYEQLTKLKREDSIATLKSLGKCAKCGKKYDTVVKVVRANATDLVDYHLRPHIGSCGHVLCGECVGDADDHSKGKEREPVQCTLCHGSMKCKWMHCQGFSKLIDKIDDITTLLEHSKDHEKVQADATRIQNDLKTALKKAQEDLINAQNDSDEKCRELTKEKGEMATRMMLEKDEMGKEITSLKHHLNEEKKKNKHMVKEPEDTTCAHSECAKCKLKEKTERMHICLGCAEYYGRSERVKKTFSSHCWVRRMNETGNGPQDHILVGCVDQMAPFVFCGNCFVNHHQDHARAKYIDEVRHQITSAVEKTEKFVDSIDKSFIEVLKKRPAFVEWQKKTANKKTLKFDEITYEEALEIHNDLVKEIDVVKKAVENTLAEFDKGLKVFEKKVTETEKVNRKRKAH